MPNFSSTCTHWLFEKNTDTSNACLTRSNALASCQIEKGPETYTTRRGDACSGQEETAKNISQKTCNETSSISSCCSALWISGLSSALNHTSNLEMFWVTSICPPNENIPLQLPGALPPGKQHIQQIPKSLYWGQGQRGRSGWPCCSSGKGLRLTPSCDVIVLAISLCLRKVLLIGQRRLESCGMAGPC